MQSTLRLKKSTLEQTSMPPSSTAAMCLKFSCAGRSKMPWRMQCAEEDNMSDEFKVNVKVNGTVYERKVEPRMLLSDFIRHELGMTGTHVGCEHGVCGTCTILFDGLPTRSCLMFAVQANGHEIMTIEGLGTMEELHPLQKAFQEKHALQCGFCTPGFLMTLVPFVTTHARPTDEEIREAIGGNLCRCTGYENIVEAVKLASETMHPGQ
jgi:carbon-monoxide dehydrogenase small subunit